MLKILTILSMLLLSSAYPSQNSSVMFQSVDEKDAVLLQDGDEKRFCGRCGMDLVKFYKTSHSAIKGEKVYQYCSIHCLVEHLYSGVSLDDPKVVDIKSLKFIDVRAAYYVVGSKKSGTMSHISKYAFLSEDDAKEFKNKYGGEIMDFYKAMEIAKKDFK